MNDWTAIKSELFADAERRPSTLAQAWRWTSAARDYLDSNAVDARTLTRGDVERLLVQLPGWGVSDKHKRTWALGLLVAAARALSPPRARSTDSARARLDAVPARSPVGKAIASVLAEAKTAHDRRRWPTCLGTFLLWCDDRGLDVADVWPGDIDAFRRDYLASGRTSPGEYVRMAKRLVQEFDRVAQLQYGEVEEACR